MNLKSGPLVFLYFIRFQQSCSVMSPRGSPSSISMLESQPLETGHGQFLAHRGHHLSEYWYRVILSSPKQSPSFCSSIEFPDNICGLDIFSGFVAVAPE